MLTSTYAIVYLCMKKIAVILAGCGHLDGSEIRESVITLLELDKRNAEVSIFAPNIDQHHVVNHLTGKEISEKRNVLIEAARIARGKVKDLKELNPDNFDALVMPGGYGAAKNLANIAFEGSNGSVNPLVEKHINSFISKSKPVGAICISPALIAKVMQGKKPLLTLGPKNAMLSEMHANEQVCSANQIAFDEKYKIVSTPAYMIDAKLSEISEGISKLITKIMELA